MRKLLIITAVAMVVCAMAFAVSLGVSVLRVKDRIESAQNSYEAAKTELSGGKSDAALRHARLALNDVSAASDELRGPQWAVAAALPILGTDAKAAQEMASIAGDLSNKAMLPILDEWDTMAGDAQAGWGNIVGKLSSAASTIKSSVSVLYECRERADALPQSHFSQLNDAANELRSLLSTVTDTLDSLGRLASVTRLGAT